MIITRTIGIDLGTTNSEVALLDPNERDLIIWKDAQNRATLPSCVWRDPRSDKIVVGYQAYARKGTKPEPISSIKRGMGTQMTVDLCGVPRSAVEVSAYILRELKSNIEAELLRRSPEVRYDVSRAIITVPAYFGLAAIEATREAGKLAGLEVTELLHEPTAAAIYYSWKHNLGDGNYLVYDLGGGTLDVSILRRTAGEFLVLGISGDIFLGGDDFDRRLAEHLRTLLVAEGNDLNLDVASNSEDRLRFNQLVALAERVKKELSNNDEIIVRDQGSIKDKSGLPVIVEITIKRATFENLIGDLLDRSIVFCQDALEKARQKSGITIEDIDHILLVGGSTYVPAVFEKVKKALCEGPHRARCEAPIRDEPETAVALGAALRAAASGLGVGDDEKRLRLWFRGAGATKRDQTTVSGYLEPLVAGLQLEGGILRLTSSTNDLLGEVEIKADRSFSFPKIPLMSETLNTFKFEVFDANRKSILVLQRSIIQNSTQKEAVGDTLSTAVLSKPIILEGTDGKRLIRHILLAEGVSLPTKSQYTFAVADPSGHIRLPIYQENRIIKELGADIGDVEVGTPVMVEIECDQQAHIQVRFNVGYQAFGGRIDPPQADTIPTEDEVNQIEARFKVALRHLDKEDSVRLKQMYDKVRLDLDEARLGADYPKIIQRSADLEGLVRDALLAEPLYPPMTTVESRYSACIDLLPQAEKVVPAVSALRIQLEATLESAKQAYQNRDHQAYEDAFRLIETSLNFLTAVTRVENVEDNRVDITVRANMALNQTKQAIGSLLITSLVKGAHDQIPEIRQCLDEINNLQNNRQIDPVEVLNRCEVLMTQARRIYRQINPEETRDALEGLLRVDSHVKDTGANGQSSGLFRNE